MELLKNVLNKEGWHITGTDLPIQLGVKFGNSSTGNAHLHKSMHEYFLVLLGEVKIKISNQVVTIQKGDLLIVNPGEPHEMISKSDDAYYILLMPKAVEDDKVVL